MLRLCSWNVSHHQPWQHLDGIDVALLQEMPQPPADWTGRVLPGSDQPSATAGHPPRDLRTAVARISDHVELSARPMTEIAATDEGAYLISRSGSLTLADVIRDGEPVLTVASIYAAWETAPATGVLYADGSAHRLVSDLSALVTSEFGHRLVIAGDLNILYGYGEDGSAYWAGRYQSVFDRLEAMGLDLLGPFVKQGVRQADPWPDELPAQSRTVPTFHANRDKPVSARRQLDYVFASRRLAGMVEVTARNAVQEWGPSEHCRVHIDVDV